jgi:hypothetical protein
MIKKITIYEQETQDGVAGLVSESNSVAYCTQASVTLKEDFDTGKINKILSGKSNPDQIDLYYLESVLVTTGWNKNDDVFEPAVAWVARNTPEDKQFNFMHDENDIIGHITGSYVLNELGERIVGDTEPPSQFDIITEAVLYNSWTEPANRERMQHLIAEMEEGKWFVSMECLFAGFNYALIDPEGKSQLVQRNETSAFLTKHLRAYGGTGEYEGHKVGRALRDIAFSGKGLVSKPANPRSIIFNSSKAFLVEDNDILTNISIGDVKMSENSNLLEKQVADLQAELTAAKEENSAMRQNIEGAKDKEFAATVEAFEASVTEKDMAIAGLDEAIKATQAKIAGLEDELAQKNEELVETVQAIDAMKQAEKTQKRLASLVDAGFNSDEAEESLALYDALDDKAFEAIMTQWTQKNTVEEVVAEDAVAENTDEAAEEDTTVDEAEAEVSEEIFDEVESAEATLVDAVEEGDELQSTRAQVAEWLEENVLNK